MVMKSVFTVVCAVLLAGGAAWAADGYRPDEYLNLDLSKAALSPKLLGPPAQFERVPVEAKAEPRRKATHVNAEPKAVAKVRIAHARTEKPRAVARTKLVRRHTNPLDAQASDTRIQVWPCRSGGI